MSARPPAALIWSRSRLALGLDQLTRASGLLPPQAGLAIHPLAQDADPEAWFEALLAPHRLEAEPVRVKYPDACSALRRLYPALVSLPSAGGFVCILKTTRRMVTLLRADGTRTRVRLAELVRWLRAPIERELEPTLSPLAELHALARLPWARVREAVLADIAARESLPVVWQLRRDPGAPFAGQLAEAGATRYFAGFVTAFATRYALMLAGWAMIGVGAMSGRLHPVWLVAWVLAISCEIAVSAFGGWCQGRLSVAIATRLRHRLLAGAMRRPSKDLLGSGTGRLLGQVIETEAFDSTALNGALLSLIAVLELIGAAVVLAGGAGASVHLPLLAMWSLVVASAALLFHRRHRRWTDERVKLTEMFVESMVGQRTRVIQQSPRHWHTNEDAALLRYGSVAEAQDRVTTRVLFPAERTWLFVGVAGLVPAIVAGASPGSMAVALGGVLLAHGALTRLSTGMVSLSSASIAWQSVRELFRAARMPAAPSDPTAALAESPTRGALLSARGVTFRHSSGGRPVLQEANFDIDPGDRVLMTGPSGGGKSTLASLMTGLRRTQAGTLLLRGTDLPTLGVAAWRRACASAPQFHDNHLLSGSLAFNLLMGRAWPPSPNDLAEAETLCRELGLGAVLDRMPSGLHQIVGDTGWQLSHGERARVYLARALLQRAELVVLDESFGALDPATVTRCLDVAVRWAPTLVVIAHP